MTDHPGIPAHEFATQTFDDIFRVKAAIERHRSAAQHSIVTMIQSEIFPNASLDQICRGVDLTIHFWLTLSVCSATIQLPRFNSSSTVAHWESDWSMEDIISRCFPTHDFSNSNTDAKIQHDLTAVNIQREAGIRICWTSNLTDHLLYNSLHRTLCIYAHKACIISHTKQVDCVIPKQVLLETLWTLEILFPYGDKKTRHFLKEEKQPLHRIHQPSPSTTLELQVFIIWRRRLEELIDAFNAPRIGYRQLRYSRNNPMQWWTFWLAAIIAVLTIIFGIISSITALEQTRLAQKSYKLALAQFNSSQGSSSV
ncbi:hypothetical protein EV356DRAFT_454782 [Viridothelium virens]|uniref:Uncharacterized protein n=1 Tax=Viridothelium virens TaxID=1048519 RepID=A0A6A6GWJ4_VIRVR|nr:hypothetical protein EV356DRAFT_454782 [Viridothelium virens]